jgi:hypothetical protein
LAPAESREADSAEATKRRQYPLAGDSGEAETIKLKRVNSSAIKKMGSLCFPFLSAKYNLSAGKINSDCS